MFFFFFGEKKIIERGSPVGAKSSKPDLPTENTLVEMFRFCLDSDLKKKDPSF